MKETENFGEEVFSRVLTKTRISEMQSFPMDLSPGRRKGGIAVEWLLESDIAKNRTSPVARSKRRL